MVSTAAAGGKQGEVHILRFSLDMTRSVTEKNKHESLFMCSSLRSVSTTTFFFPAVST